MKLFGICLVLLFIIAENYAQILRYSGRDWVQQCTGGCFNSSQVGSFCSEVVDYSFCKCLAVPATDGLQNGLTPICGVDNLDQLARSFYLRGTGTATKSGMRPTSGSQKCKDAIKDWACLSVHSKCLEGIQNLSYKDVCREHCWSLKRACSSQEQCMDLPVAECTGISDSSKLLISSMTILIMVLFCTNL